MKVTILPHAWEQMAERKIPASRVREVLANPSREYPGDRGRTVAERQYAGERSAIKVVYNWGLEDERIVVSVMRGRPKATRR